MDRIILLVFLLITVFIDILCSSIFSETEYNFMVYALEGLQFFALLISILYNVYFYINFTAWLKNKHDIKRW